MTREETIAAIAVMQAWVDGKSIQFESPIDAKWIDLSPSKPVWDWNGANYRIKPEPLTIFVNQYGSDLSGTHYLSKADAIRNQYRDQDCAVVREFIEVLP